MKSETTAENLFLMSGLILGSEGRIIQLIKTSNISNKCA